MPPAIYTASANLIQINDNPVGILQTSNIRANLAGRIRHRKGAVDLRGFPPSAQSWRCRHDVQQNNTNPVRKSLDACRADNLLGGWIGEGVGRRNARTRDRNPGAWNWRAHGTGFNTKSAIGPARGSKAARGVPNKSSRQGREQYPRGGGKAGWACAGERPAAARRLQLNHARRINHAIGPGGAWRTRQAGIPHRGRGSPVRRKHRSST
jgi:hypothetical protein